MRKRIILVGIALLTLYFGTWLASYKLGIRDWMANMRYFHYGSHPGSVGDKIGYVIYWPIYKTRYIIQTLKDEGHDDVHWSDRKD